MDSKLRFLLSFLWGLLAVCHFLVIQMDGDGVGVFDLAMVVLCFFFTCRFIILLKAGEPIVFNVGSLIVWLAYVVFISVAGLSLLFGEVDNFSVALLLKQIQYALLFWCSWEITRNMTFRQLKDVLILLGLTTAICGFIKMGFGRNELRLGLLFKDGVSSNPAGFALSTLLFSLVYFMNVERKSRDILAAFVICLALILTFSRTNVLIFMVFALFILVQRYDIRNIIKISSLILFLFFLVYELNIFGLKKIYGRNPFVYLNIFEVLQSSSYSRRLRIIWWKGSDVWVDSWKTIFLGFGIGMIRPYDSLFFALLFNTGVLGFTAYMNFLYQAFKRGFRVVQYLIFFILLNGISTETTINSFRSMQIFIFVVVLAIRLEMVSSETLLSPKHS